MMRRIAVILFCVLMCQAVNAQVELGHQKKYFVDFPYNIQPSELDINCKISQVEYTNYELEYKFGEFQTGSQIGSAQYQYNTKGQLTRLSRKGDGWFWLGEYDWHLQYDANGNIVSTKYVYENGKLSKVIWNKCVIRMYYTNGILNKVVKYNESNGKELYTVSFQNGDAIKKVVSPSYWNNNEAETKTYSYNNHKLIKGEGITYTYNAKGLVSRMVQRYRKIANDYEFITGSNGQGTKVVEYIYDYTYEYDSKGNWIKRTCAEKDENGYIQEGTLTVRKITYGSGSSTSQNTGYQSTPAKTGQNSVSSNTDSTALLESFKEYCKQGDWDKAYNPWTVLFKEYPECSQTLYSNGVNIVKRKIQLATSGQEQQVWMDTLIMVYDQRIKYFAAKSEKYDEGYILGRKGVDLLKYRKNSLTEAYNILKKSVDLRGEKSEAGVIQSAAQASVAMYKSNQINLSEFTSNYEQYTKLLPLIDCKDGDREQASKALSEMSTYINR